MVSLRDQHQTQTRAFFKDLKFNASAMVLICFVLLITDVSLNLYFVYCQRRQTDGPG